MVKRLLARGPRSVPGERTRRGGRRDCVEPHRLRARPRRAERRPDEPLHRPARRQRPAAPDGAAHATGARRRLRTRVGAGRPEPRLRAEPALLGHRPDAPDGGLGARRRGAAADDRPVRRDAVVLAGRPADRVHARGAVAWSRRRRRSSRWTAAAGTSSRCSRTGSTSRPPGRRTGARSPFSRLASVDRPLDEATLYLADPAGSHVRSLGATRAARRLAGLVARRQAARVRLLRRRRTRRPAPPPRARRAASSTWSAPTAAACGRLTRSKADDEHPSWSPDGTRIAFASGFDVRSQGHAPWLMVIRARGGKPVRIGRMSGVIDPSWSPGRRSLGWPHEARGRPPRHRDHRRRPAQRRLLRRVLGLRLVKKSVNQDDPTVYHLFYGDEEGAPGNDITFFEYPGARAGKAGAGMVHTRRLARRLARGDRLLGEPPGRRGHRRRALRGRHLRVPRPRGPAARA